MGLTDWEMLGILILWGIISAVCVVRWAGEQEPDDTLPERNEFTEYRNKWRQK